MESLAQSEPFNFKVVFGFTDSTFLQGGTHKQMQDFIQLCKDKLGMIVELKAVYVNSFYGKKNRFVGWTGNEEDTALSDATEDDFVYLDPPYHPTSITANFTDYSANGFSEKDQKALSKVFVE